ncbi:MAG TPA: hypothetical protein VM534_05115 [Thermoanaerobaculia bacterium]|nr:hypothetical protein [Thermoanaerobaculia bacterium]
MISLEDRKIRRLASGTSPRYADGHLVYSHFGILHSAPFDLKRLELRGEAKPVLEDVHNHSASGFTAFEVSASGSLVYIPGAPDLRFRDSELVWLDREGNVRPVTDEKRPIHAASLSPDGKRIVADIHHPTLEESDLWMFETDHARWTRFTFAQGGVGDPIWSSDGKWIIFSSWKDGTPRLFRVASDGSRPPEALTGAGPEMEYPGGISSRDNVLVFMRQTDDQHWNLLTLALDGSGKEQPFLATPAIEAWPVFSPDGRWIAYESFETDSSQIHVRPYPGPGPRITVSRDGGSKAFWSRDGRELFYRRGKEVWAVPVSTGETFKAGAPKQLFRADFLGGLWQKIDVAPDGRFLVVRHPPESRPQRRLVYIPNWTQELAGRN